MEKTIQTELIRLWKNKCIVEAEVPSQRHKVTIFITNKQKQWEKCKGMKDMRENLPCRNGSIFFSHCGDYWCKASKICKINKEFSKKFLCILSVLILVNVSSFSVPHSESVTLSPSWQCGLHSVNTLPTQFPSVTSEDSITSMVLFVPRRAE